MLNSSKKILKLIDMLAYFKVNGVSYDPKKLQPVLDYQNLIGCSSIAEIADMYNALDTELKRTFDWVNFHALETLNNKYFQVQAENIEFKNRISELEAEIEPLRKKVYDLEKKAKK